MKKLFKKLIALGLLTCTMFTAAVFPSYAASTIYAFTCDPPKEDEYGTVFAAGTSIKGEGPVFEYAHSYGTITTNTHSISLQPIYFIAFVQVNFTDFSYGHRKVSEPYGVLQVHTRYIVNMNSTERYNNTDEKELFTLSGKVRASHSDIDDETSRLPNAISSNFSWSIFKSAEEIFGS